MAAIREILAKNIKENRRKLGITQSELAERADISTNFVAMIELKRKFPAPETLDKLAAALNIETPELFFTPASAEAALRRLHEAILGDVERAISEGVKMALTRGFSGHLKK
ncbi:MAG: helix-turn-helix transcriptional regulator [Spirochaetales bacterium]|jgi:transcriptional regulator with XRE-family HTH domain|nr:helix-turn-helix transcriptional regulator [Spirochaetales bacterium]